MQARTRNDACTSVPQATGSPGTGGGMEVSQSGNCEAQDQSIELAELLLCCCCWVCAPSRNLGWSSHHSTRRCGSDVGGSRARPRPLLRSRRRRWARPARSRRTPRCCRPARRSLLRDQCPGSRSSIHLYVSSGQLGEGRSTSKRRVHRAFPPAVLVPSVTSEYARQALAACCCSSQE